MTPLGNDTSFFKGLLGASPAFTTRKLVGHWSTFCRLGCLVTGLEMVGGLQAGAQSTKIGCLYSNMVISTNILG